MEQLEKQASLFSADNPLITLLQHIPAGVFLLNLNRQIIFVNGTAQGLASSKVYQSMVGLRPGEYVGCVHSSGGSGCGTTQACRYCGAVKAILRSQAGQPSVEECQILW